MLQNAYFLARIGADTAENEQHFAEILPTDALPTEHRCPPTQPRPRVDARAQPRAPAVWARRVVANVWKNVARFRLRRHRFLQENTRFAAFFKIYQIIELKILKFINILQILQHLQICC